jgi:hypothetical protein
MRRLVIVTGLSGAGKSQALKIVRRFGLCHAAARRRASTRIVGTTDTASERWRVHRSLPSVAGRTYTVYAVLFLNLNAVFKSALGSSQLTAHASGSLASISGDQISLTPPESSLFTGLRGEIEVCPLN